MWNNTLATMKPSQPATCKSYKQISILPYYRDMNFWQRSDARLKSVVSLFLEIPSHYISIKHICKNHSSDPSLSWYSLSCPYVLKSQHRMFKRKQLVNFGSLCGLFPLTVWFCFEIEKNKNKNVYMYIFFLPHVSFLKHSQWCLQLLDSAEDHKNHCSSSHSITVRIRFVCQTKVLIVFIDYVQDFLLIHLKVSTYYFSSCASQNFDPPTKRAFEGNAMIGFKEVQHLLITMLDLRTTPILYLQLQSECP